MPLGHGTYCTANWKSVRRSKPREIRSHHRSRVIIPAFIIFSPSRLA